MDEAIAAIEARPTLRAWLVAGEWKTTFDRASVARGESYANDNLIRNLEWIEFHSTGELMVTADVQGTRTKPYETSLEFQLMGKERWFVTGACTCPVHFNCKHGAALAIFLRKKLVAAKIFNAPIPASELQLGAWLTEIESAARQAATTPEKSTKPSTESRFLAYCIEESLAGGYHFALRVASRLKDGTIRIQGSNATADPSRPPKYMAKEDIVLASLFRQRQNKHGGWGTMPMKGPDWDDLLDGALATERVYFGNSSRSYKDSSDYRPVTAGPAETVEAAWEEMPDGNVRPVLRGGRPGIIVLPTVPPRYFDPHEIMLGPVANSLPGPVLEAWTRGPVVKAESVARLIERFSSVPGTALPMPRAVESVTRPAMPPSPVLKVHKHVFGDHWRRQEMIIGEVLFQYGDSPRLQAPTKSTPPEHSALRDGKRITWPRDIKAERAAENRLLIAGTRLISTVIPSALLGSATYHAVIPAEPYPTPELAWIELLEGPEFAKLHDAGWTIEVDPACGLTLHDVTDFIPAIEAETDHGIDWFRFDVSYEIDGRKVSLIPVIAHAIARNFPPADSPELPEFLLLPAGDQPEDGFIRFPAKPLMEIVDQVRHLFQGGGDPGRIDRLTAAGMADALAIDSSETIRALAKLGKSLRDLRELPAVELPSTVKAELRGYQHDGFRWLQFLAAHGLHGILADDMGLGKTLQTLAHLAAEQLKHPGKPSLVIAPTSVVPNWAAEAAKFVPSLKVLTLHGPDRAALFKDIADADVVLTSYPLLGRDFDELSKHEWHVVALDEAQYIKNPKALAAQSACQLKAAHRLCLSGTPMENHLGELWSLMRFLMPGFLGDEKSFNTRLRKPIERDRSTDAQLALNRRVSPLILRRTKDQVAKELPAKTEIIHHIDLTKKQTDLYESVRAAMDKRVRDAIADKGMAKSHIIVLDALLKLRQICCHPQLLKSAAAAKVTDSAKLDHLTEELLPTLLEEGRRILLFSQFTSMLALIEAHLEKEGIPFLKLTGQTKDRASLVKKFQTGEVPVFLISLKAGGTGLNLTAADTVIHYDPWWNPAAENQATDRAHRIGQTKPVFVHKLVCRGTIEDRILELQKHKSALVEALLSEETTRLKIDPETLSHLLAPLE